MLVSAFTWRMLLKVFLLLERRAEKLTACIMGKLKG